MILFDNVTKTYPSATRPALDGVTLEVSRGCLLYTSSLARSAPWLAQPLCVVTP